MLYILLIKQRETLCRRLDVLEREPVGGCTEGYTLQTQVLDEAPMRIVTLEIRHVLIQLQYDTLFVTLSVCLLQFRAECRFNYPHLVLLFLKSVMGDCSANIKTTINQIYSFPTRRFNKERIIHVSQFVIFIDFTNRNHFPDLVIIIGLLFE